MRVFNQFSKNRVIHLTVVVLMVVALYGGASFSLLAQTSLKLSTVEHIEELNPRVYRVHKC